MDALADSATFWFQSAGCKPCIKQQASEDAVLQDDDTTFDTAQWTQSLAARPDHQTTELKNSMSLSALLHKVRGIAASQGFSVDLRACIRQQGCSRLKEAHTSVDKTVQRPVISLARDSRDGQEICKPITGLD